MAKPVALHVPAPYPTHFPYLPPFYNTPGVGHSATVYMNGLPVHRVGDTSDIHCIPGTVPPVCDVDIVIEGAFPTVICEGRLLAPVGAKTTGAFIAGPATTTVIVKD